MCYADLNCFKDVLDKMAIFTSMPNKAEEAMQIIERDYDLFGNEFKEFFIDLQLDVKNNFL